MDVCFFGGYDRSYPRNAVLRRGLGLAGVSISECHVQPGYKFWLRYPLLLSRWLTVCASHLPRQTSVLFVPEFCQKDVPLAYLLRKLGSRRVIFDPLATRFETKIQDWRRQPPGSLSAWWNKTIDRWAFRMADFILADTQAHLEYYARVFGISAYKMAVLPVGFDDRIFCQSLVRDAPSSARTASPFTALFFGSFLPLHGVEFIIEAAGCLWEKDRSVRIVLIGSGQTLARAEARVSEMGLGNVIFEGWQSQTTIAEAVAARADICLGIFGRTAKAARVVPHKIYQAMALRKAVITARTPAIEEFFADRQDIYLCDRAEPESLAGAIRELKDNADLRESIAQKGYEAVWTRYHPAALGATLGEILDRVS